jgi:hypothetical protein
MQYKLGRTIFISTCYALQNVLTGPLTFQSLRVSIEGASSAHVGSHSIVSAWTI